MRRLRGLVGALGLAALLALVAAPAHAQTPPPPPPQAGPGTSPGGSLMETVIPQPACGPPSPSATAFPLSAYTIDSDEGGFTAVSRKAVGTLTELTFATVRWVVGVGMWLVGWAFSFGVANRLAAPMASVAGRYQSGFYAPLVGSVLFLSAAYGAVQVFRGRLARGVGEFALSLLLVAGFGTWFLANPKGFLDTAFATTAHLAGSVATVALGTGTAAGCPAPGGQAPGGFALRGLDAAVAPLTAQVEQAFVRRPYELLEWGTPVPAACARQEDLVLAAGPGGDRDAVVSLMDTPACRALYAFNRQPSTERLGVAVLVLAAAGVLVVSLGMVAGTVVVAQVVAVALIAVMPFAALGAALPRSGRVVLWAWGFALLRALVTVVVMAGFLTFLLLAADALLATGQGQPLLVQMAVLNLIAVLGFTLRRRVLRSGQRAAATLTRRIPTVHAGLAVAAGASGLGSGAPGFVPGVAHVQGAGDQMAPQVRAAVARTWVGQGSRA